MFVQAENDNNFRIKAKAEAKAETELKAEVKSKADEVGEKSH